MTQNIPNPPEINAYIKTVKIVLKYRRTRMKISELIKELTKCLEEHGDLPVEGSFEGCVAPCELSLISAKGKVPVIWKDNVPISFRDGYPEEDTLFIGEKTDGEYF
jgi:hypothetical protein